MHTPNISYSETFKEKLVATLQSFFTLIENNLDSHSIELIKKALVMAEYGHQHQSRKSGEPYIIHPLSVAYIVAQWGLIDTNTIIGALLHDTIEDTTISKTEISKEFGSNVANIVDSLTKLDAFKFKSKEHAHAEYIKKLIITMETDIRVILIKLADRTHNIQTLAFMKPAKQISISKETLEIYVPIAYQLGLYKLHIELAEQCFKYVYPLRYKLLVSSLNRSQLANKDIHQQIKKEIESHLQHHGLSPQILTTPYSFYKLYQRIKHQSKKFDYKYYSIEFKIIVEQIEQCYATLGLVHNLFQPIPDKFKDLIAIPRANGYQSLHTMLIAHNITIFIQIRTKTMHKISEYGLVNKLINSQQKNNRMADSLISNVMAIKQSNESSAINFLKILKNNLSIVYVFTSDRQIVYLPCGSSVLDFAYLVDENLGNKIAKVKINHKFTSIFYKLKNGDLIDIITAEYIYPQKSWLKHVVTNKAYNNIIKQIKN